MNALDVTSQRLARVAALRRARPRDRVLRGSLLAMVGLVAYAWLAGDFGVIEAFGARRLENLRRFATEDVVPFALRGTDWSLADLARWFAGLAWPVGVDALLRTFWMATLAMALAASAGLVAAPLAARTFAPRDPYLWLDGRAGRLERALRHGATAVVRAALVALRACPEYVLAFFLLGMLGPGAWPAVLALALHNAGILGRLGGEVVENLEAAPLRALAQLGARRGALAAVGAFPIALGRYLLYVFYRFETCVREATVLGMLGILSLGYWIREARSRGHHDEMLAYVAMGGVLVLVGDLVSGAVRRRLRRA